MIKYIDIRNKLVTKTQGIDIMSTLVSMTQDIDINQRKIVASRNEKVTNEKVTSKKIMSKHTRKFVVKLWKM